MFTTASAWFTSTLIGLPVFNLLSNFVNPTIYGGWVDGSGRNGGSSLGACNLVLWFVSSFPTRELSFVQSRGPQGPGTMSSDGLTK